MNLSRRRLLQAAIAAPFVVTTPGLLMPVRRLWTPPEPKILVDDELFVITEINEVSATVQRMGCRSVHKVAPAMDISLTFASDLGVSAAAALGLQVGDFLRVKR